MHNDIVMGNAARIAGVHGYRIEGDVAFLNAELAVAAEQTTGSDLALQLWACPAPYVGGRLEGVLVAEAAVGQAKAPGLLNVSGSSPSHTPRGEYSMVLVLASGDRIHDYSNFAGRETFTCPHFAGAVGYALDGSDALLSAERIQNPRASGSLSGALQLELWALPQPYAGTGAAELASGARLATAAVGVLGGQYSADALEYRTPFTAPPAGRFHIALLLQESSAAAGSVTRDYCNFALPFEQAPAVEAAPPNKVREKVSISTASVEMLMTVAGISRKLAQEIVRSRPFKSLDDLLRVRGIGEKILRKLKPYLTL